MDSSTIGVVIWNVALLAVARCSDAIVRMYTLSPNIIGRIIQSCFQKTRLNGPIALAAYMKTVADGHPMVIFAANVPMKVAKTVLSGEVSQYHGN